MEEDSLMHRLAFLVASVLAFASCKSDNSQSCELAANKDSTQCTDAGTHGGQCSNASDCTSTPNFPVCDTADNGGTCVLCTANDHTACTGLTPACSNHACVACASDSDCGTDGVCLPTGACADPGTII